MSDKHDNRPIGIFDSGIGGLTVAASIARKMPRERLVYFGDTAHLPYGEKSAAAIRSYAGEILRFLLDSNCKAIVIACNTASAVAFRHVKKLAGNIPVIDVIDPTSAKVASELKSGTVGVIATKATVNSRIYAKRIEKANPALKVTMLATPLLVAMIEEGFFNNTISKAIIADYLQKPNLRSIDALILGCTHFPLIRKEVEAFYDGSTPVVDSSEIVANITYLTLKKHGMLAESPIGKHHFYVSDLTPSFRESTSIFFGERLNLERKNLW